MIQSSMQNDISGAPRSLSNGNIVGKPSSKSVIVTSVSKPSCGSANLVSKTSGPKVIDTPVASQI